ncbi:hypothetical protein [Hymenobacter sp. YC55]|uniref:hypothetical protein n=1 Tax=Hymenobacter sp. YC55 TaxID=3034019 RepID=UPI0023F61A54|nr:hypothetical protein [Hymenobacter sp. YC55]MDF7814562.1 hypothetical protein [Hymenobacter sp. YC55]
MPHAVLPARSHLAAAVWHWLRRWHGWLLAGLWLLVQLWCWHSHHGIQLTTDSKQYLKYAEQLAATGTFAEGHYLRYVGYPLFLSVFLKLKLGTSVIALAQIALSGLAARALYGTAWRLSGGHWVTAALAGLLFVAWPDIQHFNVFLLTESLFTSLLVLSLWLVARARTVGGAALALAVLVVTATVRPNGFVAVGAAGLAALVWLQERKPRWRNALLLLAALVCLPLAWVGLNGLLRTFTLIETYQQGIIIYGDSASNIHSAAPLQLPASTASPLWRLGFFIWHNPQYFAQLASLKLAYFMGFPKPYYSTLHCALLAFALPVLYWLAVRGLARQVVARPVRVYAATVILLQALVVMLTVEDWDVRFSAPVLSHWFLLAALGAQPLLRRLERKLVALGKREAGSF